MRNPRRILEQLLITLLLLSACSPALLFRRHLAPAQLEEEILKLEFLKNRVLVDAGFTFRPRTGLTQQTYALCYFPAAGFPVRFRGKKLPHPQIRQLQITDRQGELPASRRGISYSFPVRFSGTTRIRIRYTAGYQMYGKERQFRYVLRSGGWWPGGIGRLRIIISNKSGYSITLNRPYRDQLSYSNYTPVEDLCAVLTPPQKAIQ